MSVDRAELNDVAADHADLVAELEAAWRQWVQHCGVVPWDRMLTLGYYSFAYPPAVASAAPDAGEA